MTKSADLPNRHRSVTIAAAVIFSALACPALAQGTAEQREACTPDALKLCSDTIPDIGKTTACMKAHESELSPRCRATFTTAADTPPAPAKVRKRRVARATPEDEAPPRERPRRFRPPEPNDEAPPMEGPRRFRGPDPYEQADDDRDIDRARSVIGHLCDDQFIDPRTCAVTERALNIVR